MDISVIIVNYKSKKKTFSCLESLQHADWEGISHEIIVVDNHSYDGIAEDIQKFLPSVIFVQNSVNSGMGGGNNFGIRHSQGEYILILNPDTKVARNAIRILFSFIKNRPEVGIVGPKLLNPDGTLQYSCVRFPALYTPIFRRTFFGRFAKTYLDDYLMKLVSHDEVMDVDWMLGSCLLVRRSDFKKAGGGFDKRFFMYFEDTDLCRRFHRVGLRVVYNPAAVVIHDHARSSAKSRWYLAIFTNKLTREHIKSWLNYFWKWRWRRA